MIAMDKYRVTLTAEERAELERLVACSKAAARKPTHARILLLADDSRGEEHTDKQIIAALGTGLRTVSRVRRQLVTEGFDTALCRRPQPPRPDKIKIQGMIQTAMARGWLEGDEHPRAPCEARRCPGQARPRPGQSDPGQAPGWPVAHR